MDPSDSGAVSTIGVVTCNRPHTLIACLESYLANCRRHDRIPTFIVADDSPDGGADKVRAALSALGLHGAAHIRYGGRVERSRFAEALARESGVPLEVVRFALMGDDRCRLSTGANRNALLLDTIDTLVLNVDDDTRGEPAVAPGAEDGMSFFAGYDPTEFWFFPDRAAAIASVSFVEIDLLRAHEALLGRAVADLGGSAHSTGRVAITLNGLVGDSGMSSPRYYLTIAGDSRLRLVSSEIAYASAFRSRQVVRAVRRRTVSTGPFFMSGFFGLDNRLLLPPFFPVQRNSDGIFGLVLRRTTSHCTGFLPFVLQHAPAPHAFEPDAMWTDAAGLQLADVVIACVLAFDAGPHLSEETRLIRLGQHLRSLGSLSVAEFDAYVHAQQQFRTIAFITALQGLLQTYAGLPEYWAADVTRMIERLTTAATVPAYTVPRDLLPGESADVSRQLAQELVRRYGELLDAWPAITTGARTLRAREVRMSAPFRATP